MPEFDSNYPYLSYITAAGDEIVLSCEGYKKWWECYGRAGFTAPPLKHIRQEYADGSLDTLAIEVAPRTLTVQMVVSGATSLERDTILQDIASRLIQVGNKRDWGKLKIQKTDGSFTYIDCVYIGGMDGINQTMPRLQLFTLNFYAGKAYFYDETQTTYDFDIYSTEGLHFPFNFGSSTHFGGAGVYFTRYITLEGFRAYPVITITGYVGALRLENATTGAVIEFSDEFFLLRGESVVIDTNPFRRSVTIQHLDGTEENGFRYLTEETDLDWFLVLGSNEVIYRQPEINPDTTCHFVYQQMRVTA